MMAGWMSLVLVATASTITIAQSRVIPAELVSDTLDAHGSPVMFLRAKRAAVHTYPYPHRAMMFTGYYRPVRRSSNGGQASGVFAQGNAVTGGAFFGGLHTPRLKGGPEPIEEPGLSNAEAQAAPASDETYDDDDGEYHAHRQEHRPGQHRGEQDSLSPQEHHEPEQIPLTTEVAQPTTEEPIVPGTEAPASRPKAHRPRKTHKRPVIVDNDDDDSGEDENETDEEEEDKPIAPFVPFKGNRRRQSYPNLNNFFPMVFSFPRVAARAGSAGSPPGAITAIANSYSTAKGGVASSVATAYGGSPGGKKRRAQPSEE